MAPHQGHPRLARNHPRRRQGDKRRGDYAGGVARSVPQQGAKQQQSPRRLHARKARQQAKRRKARHGNLRKQPHGVRNAEGKH